MNKLLIGCLVLMCSCGYTRLHDPLRITKPEPVKIEPIMDYHDGVPPDVRRDYYGRFSHPTYYNSHSPYIYSGYYQPPTRIFYANTRNNKQAQSYTVVEVRQPVPVAKSSVPETSKEDKALSQRVWQKRVDPRNRKAPQPTPKNK